MSLFLMVLMKKIKNAVKLSLLPMTVTLVILILFRFVFLLGYVPTASMEPTLKTSECVFGETFEKGTLLCSDITRNILLSGSRP